MKTEQNIPQITKTAPFIWHLQIHLKNTSGLIIVSDPDDS